MLILKESFKTLASSYYEDVDGTFGRLFECTNRKNVQINGKNNTLT